MSKIIPFEQSDIYPEKFLSYLRDDFPFLLGISDKYSYSDQVIKELFDLSWLVDIELTKKKLFIFVLAIGKIDIFFDLHTEIGSKEVFNFLFSAEAIETLVSHHPKSLPFLTNFTKEHFMGKFVFPLRGRSPLSLRYNLNSEPYPNTIFRNTIKYFEEDMLPAIIEGSLNFEPNDLELDTFCKFIFETICSTNCSKPEQIMPFVAKTNPQLLDHLSTIFLESYENGAFFDPSDRYNVPHITHFRAKKILTSILQFPQFARVAFKNNLTEAEHLYDIDQHLRDNPEFFAL